MRMTQEEINNLANEALSAACLVIQTKLGVMTGDTAGYFFSNSITEKVLAEYIQLELALAEDK